MAVYRKNLFSDETRGAGVLEVLMAIAIVAIAAPFVYTQVAQTTQTALDIRMAKKIINSRGAALNFIRMHADAWPDTAQIRLDADDLTQIADDASAGFIDKYAVSGASITDVYLAFNLGLNRLRTESVARNIGMDAAVVDTDGIAYGSTWAVQAPDFNPGDLIYKISRDVSGMDTEKYLHRGTSGEDMLNVMQRDLNMGGHNIYRAGGILGKSAKTTSISTTFISADDVVSDAAYFSAGANIDGGTVQMGNMRVTGDITGFRNITASSLNGNTYTTRGRAIVDRATVSGSVNVSRDLTLKSDTARTISSFDGISAGYVSAPFISTDEIIFYDNFGLTLSGELLMSTNAPLKIGTWTFPSTTPPKFSKLTLTRAKIPAPVQKKEFSELMKSGWTGGMQNVTQAPVSF